MGTRCGELPATGTRHNHVQFRVVEPGGEIRESFVKDVHAVRSGRGEHEFDTYVWDDSEGMWVTAPDDDDDE